MRPGSSSGSKRPKSHGTAVDTQQGSCVPRGTFDAAQASPVRKEVVPDRQNVPFWDSKQESDGMHENTIHHRRQAEAQGPVVEELAHGLVSAVEGLRRQSTGDPEEGRHHEGLSDLVDDTQDGRGLEERGPPSQAVDDASVGEDCADVCGDDHPREPRTEGI